MRLPEKPRLRTTSPKVWPFVSTIRWPAMYGRGGDDHRRSLLVLVAGVGRASAGGRGPLARAPCIGARAAVAQQRERVVTRCEWPSPQSGATA